MGYCQGSVALIASTGSSIGAYLTEAQLAGAGLVLGDGYSPSLSILTGLDCWQ